MGFFKKTKPTMTRRQSLEARPVRNPHVRWDKKQGVIALRIPLKQSVGTRLAKSIFQAPAERELLLDAIGGEIWLRCDGKNRTLDLVEYVRTRYQFCHKEALLSVTTYISQLGRRGLIGLAVDKAED